MTYRGRPDQQSKLGSATPLKVFLFSSVLLQLFFKDCLIAKVEQNYDTCFKILWPDYDFWFRNRIVIFHNVRSGSGLVNYNHNPQHWLLSNQEIRKSCQKNTRRKGQTVTWSKVGDKEGVKQTDIQIKKKPMCRIMFSKKLFNFRMLNSRETRRNLTLLT